MALRFPVSTPKFRNSASKPPFKASPIGKSSRTAPEAHDVVQTFVKKDNSQKVVSKVPGFAKSTFQGAIEDEAKDQWRNLLLGQNHAEEQPPTAPWGTPSSWSRPPPSSGGPQTTNSTTISPHSTTTAPPTTAEAPPTSTTVPHSTTTVPPTNITAPPSTSTANEPHEAPHLHNVHHSSSSSELKNQNALPGSENVFLTVIEDGQKKVFFAKIEYLWELQPDQYVEGALLLDEPSHESGGAEPQDGK